MNAIYKHVVDGCIRYIGETKETPEKRLRKHLEEARGPKQNRRLDWLRGLIDPPSVEVIEWCLPGDAANREKYWIALAREYGCHLVNGNDGGGGPLKHTAETRAKISADKKGKPGHPHTLKTIEVLRAANLGENNPSYGKKQTSEHVEKRVSKMRGPDNHQFGVPHTLETREKISAKLTGRPLSEDCKAKISAALTGRKHSPAHLEKMRKPRSAGAVENMRAAQQLRRTKEKETRSNP